MNGRRADPQAIAPNGQGPREALTVRAAKKEAGTTATHGSARKNAPGPTAPVAMSGQAAVARMNAVAVATIGAVVIVGAPGDRSAAMANARPTGIALRAIGPAIPADRDAPRRVVMTAYGRPFAQAPAREAVAPRQAGAISGLSVCAPVPTATTPAIAPAKAPADRLHANRSSFPDRSG